MLRISNWKVSDLKESVIASGNAMRLEPCEYTEEEFHSGLVRMVNLVKHAKTSGINCHKNALCGIRVAFDVVYPQYWSMEFQRYHFADIVTSSSKMHRLSKMDVRRVSNKYVTDKTVKELEDHIEHYNYLIRHPKCDEFKYVDPITGEKIVIKGRDEAIYTARMFMISNCPMGLELFMRVNTNYLQLATIYHQRKNHPLKEDWGEFCKWVEQLPYAKELIIGNE